MPELPDVEIFRRQLDGHAKDRTIAQAQVLDERLLEDVTPQQLIDALAGRRIVATRRHGKHLLAELDEGRFLVLHFGMSGEILPLEDGSEIPKYTALHLRFDDGNGLAVTSRRRLGHIGLAADAEGFAGAHDLGPDALDPALDGATFREALGSPRGAIKSALMDQSKLAGIGNIYADEILFRARLNPATHVGDLGDEDIGNLLGTIREVLKEAVERDILSEFEHDSLPQDWLLAHREKGGTCPRCGTKLQISRVGGRTGYFCPSCQPG